MSFKIMKKNLVRDNMFGIIIMIKVFKVFFI